MGLDPYNPGELTDQVVDLLEGPFAALVPTLQVDLAESSTALALPVDLQWVQDALAALGGSVNGATTSPLFLPDLGDKPAHEVGYERARRFRERFQFPVEIHDLQALIRDRCRWDPEPATVPISDGVGDRINGLIGQDQAGRPHLATPAVGHAPESQRFFLGRALFFWAGPESGTLPRLLTRSSSWAQRASRAFAAELLVPASELRSRVSSKVSYEQVADLAKQFGVSELVIRHQIENHRIALILDL